MMKKLIFWEITYFILKRQLYIMKELKIEHRENNKQNMRLLYEHINIIKNNL